MIFNNAVGSKSFLKEGKTLFLLIATTLCFGSCSHLENKWGEYSPKGIKPEAPIFVPAWIKNNAGWWATDKIDDITYISGIQYLVQKGIIVV